MYAVIGWTVFLLGVSNFFFLHLCLPATILCVVISVIFCGLHIDLSSPWDHLTLKGTVFHPALTSGLPQHQKGVPSFLIALLIVAVFSSLWMANENAFPTKTAAVSAPSETNPAVSSMTSHFMGEPQPTPTEQENPNALLEQKRLGYMVTGTDGSSYNRYLGSDYQIYWYYDAEPDEEGTAEFTALCPDPKNLAAIFDYAISLGIDASDYIASHSGAPDVTVASDPTDTESTAPAALTEEDVSAAIASVLPAEIGTFRTGSGLMDGEEESGSVRVSQCQLNSRDSSVLDLSAVTAEVLLSWTASQTWELKSIRFNGNVRIGAAGSYTVSNFGQTRSADVTITSDAMLDSDGSLVIPSVTIHHGNYLVETSMIVAVMDNPGNMVATKETGSVYLGRTSDNEFYLYFDADMLPTFFNYDP